MPSKFAKKLWILALSVAFLLSGCQHSETKEQSAVKVALPYEEAVFGINETYYKEWLETQTGLTIEFTFIPQTYTAEYLNMLFASSDSGIDALFFSNKSAPTMDELEVYGAQGKIEDLKELIDNKGVHLPKVLKEHKAYDLRLAMTASNGAIYYMPALNSSLTTKIFQTMWINTKWLEETGLYLPTTTEEFENVLTLMAQQHPEGAALIGSTELDNTNAVHFLMNSFTVCDSKNSYMAVENGQVYFPPQTEQWREGLQYCHRLYKKGLMPIENFTYSQDQMKSLCNDPENPVGVFCAKNISDIFNEQSPELISKYLSVPPLKGPTQAGIAISETPMPRPGGIILSSSKNKEAVFALMDLMCSEEAFLIGHYGQEDVDWGKASVGDIAIDGRPAVIAIKNQDKLQRSDYSLRVVGPFVTRTEYADKIAWKGMSINQSEYLKVRVFRTYEPYAQTDPLKTILFSENVTGNEDLLHELTSYVRANITAFITGTADIKNDTAWDNYLVGLKQREVEFLIGQVQQSCNEMEEN